MSRHKSQGGRFLSLVLRHRPGLIGLQLDNQGWVDVDELLQKCATHGRLMTRAELDEIVANNDKQRFRFSPDGRRIRANQGHSIPIDLDLEPRTPPDLLYHGTAERFVPSIMQSGLQKRKRHHVHLSADVETARKVGERHGRVVILVVAAGPMAAAGHTFFCSDNGVWLTDHVPPSFLTPFSAA